jgi:hypothetical protein
MKADATLAVRDTFEALVQRESAVAPEVGNASMAVEQRADVREAAARIETAVAKIDRAESEGHVDVSLFGNYMRMDSGFPQRGFAPNGGLERVRGQFNYWSAGAMVTVPILNRNQGDVAVARAEQTGAAAAYDAARLAAEAEVASARARDERAREAVKIYGAGAQALARQNLTVVGQSYELGRLTVFEVLAERRRYLDVERAYTEACVRRTRHEQRSTGRLERDDDERHTRDDEQGRRGAGRHRSAGSRSRGRRTCGYGSGAVVGHVVEMSPSTGAPVPPAASAATSKSPLPTSSFPLSHDAVERAEIVVAPVTSGHRGRRFVCPGVVEPNAYRQVVVTPLVAGRVTKVGPALGDRVRRGQTLAEIYSPALAEAQTRYVSAQAMLDAHDRELQRTAEARRDRGREPPGAGEDSRRARGADSGCPECALAARVARRLGVGTREYGSWPDVSATTTVPAPIDGVVTERGANVGLNVDTATKLFTVVDLSTVWVVADLYEKDFSRVRVGSEAAITTSARPDVTLRGRVSYIDPQVSAGTRTAKVRIEGAKYRGELRLGM